MRVVSSMDDRRKQQWCGWRWVNAGGSVEHLSLQDTSMGSVGMLYESVWEVGGGENCHGRVEAWSTGRSAQPSVIARGSVTSLRDDLQSRTASVSGRRATGVCLPAFALCAQSAGRPADGPALIGYVCQKRQACSWLVLLRLQRGDCCLRLDSGEPATHRRRPGLSPPGRGARGSVFLRTFVLRYTYFPRGHQSVRVSRQAPCSVLASVCWLLSEWCTSSVACLLIWDRPAATDASRCRSVLRKEPCLCMLAAVSCRDRDVATDQSQMWGPPPLQSSVL
jgi:hypothetical protein